MNLADWIVQLEWFADWLMQLGWVALVSITAVMLTGLVGRWIYAGVEILSIIWHDWKRR